jgi:hypothetical protein
MMRGPAWGAALAALVAGSGCSPSPPTPPVASGSLPLSDIVITLLARSNGDVAQFIVNLTGGDQSDVVLGGGDALAVTGPGGVQEALVAFPGGSGDQAPTVSAGVFGSGYVAEIQTAATDFQLVFQHAGAAVTSPITLPPAFALTGPAAQVSRAAPIQIAWDEAPPPVATSVAVIGGCLASPIQRSLSPDPGALALQPGDLFVDASTAQCTVAFEVSHTTTASLAGGLYVTSSATFAQIRTIPVDTAP